MFLKNSKPLWKNVYSKTIFFVFTSSWYKVGTKSQSTWSHKPLRKKCPNTELFLSGLGLNTGKYRPEITPYLDTFHAVNIN